MNVQWLNEKNRLESKITGQRAHAVMVSQIMQKKLWKVRKEQNKTFLLNCSEKLRHEFVG